MYDKVKGMLNAICRAIARHGQSENRPVFRWAKPGLEWLEKRIVPTVTWVGNTSSDWATAANWRQAGGGAPVAAPGLGMSTDDNVDINPAKGYKNNPIIDAGANYTITSLSFGPNVDGNALSINGSLTVKPFAAAPLPSSLNFGSILLGPNGVLDLQSNFTWGSKGSIEGGTVQVDGGGAMSVTADAQNFRSSLLIGGAGGTGTVTLADMNKNLMLLSGGSITVNPRGTLDFAQTANSDTAGGIDPASTGGTIDIQGGTVIRSAVAVATGNSSSARPSSWAATTAPVPTTSAASSSTPTRT